MTVRRAGVRLLLGLVLAGVLLEAILQVVAWVVWARGEGRREASLPGDRAGARVVLCVGDSFTYGYGASAASQSYPAQLERILEASGTGPWKVVNRGWPGQNSWDVLRRLGRQLEESTPEVVCVMVGGNDYWSLPERHDVTAEGGGDGGRGFPLRWRTARLFRLLRHRFVASGDEARSLRAPPAFLGEWFLGNLPLRFSESGRLELPDRSVPWTLEEDRLALQVLPRERLVLEWRVEGRFLALRGPGLALLLTRPTEAEVETAAEPDPESSNPIGDGWAALHAGDAEEAVRLFEIGLARTPEDPMARESIVAGLVRAGRRDEALAHVAWIEERAGATADPRYLEALFGAKDAVGEREEAMALARDYVRDHPDSGKAWAMLGPAAFLAGDREFAEEALERALELVPESTGGWHAHILRVHSQVIREKDPDRALRGILRAYLLDGDEGYTVQNLQGGYDLFTPERFERHLDALALSPEEAARLRDLYRRSRTTPEDTPAILKAHLRQILELCRARGARAFLLSYPLPHAPLETILREVAEERGVGWIGMRPHFEALLRTRPRESLFIPDGHCNDEGYGVVAKLVSEAVLRDVR